MNGIIKIAIVCVSLACGGLGCTSYPPTTDDRGVVAPETISDEQSRDGAPVLPNYNPWWMF